MTMNGPLFLVSRNGSIGSLGSAIDAEGGWSGIVGAGRVVEAWNTRESFFTASGLSNTPPFVSAGGLPAPCPLAGGVARPWPWAGAVGVSGGTLLTGLSPPVILLGALAVAAVAGAGAGVGAVAGAGTCATAIGAARAPARAIMANGGLIAIPHPVGFAGILERNVGHAAKPRRIPAPSGSPTGRSGGLRVTRADSVGDMRAGP